MKKRVSYQLAPILTTLTLLLSSACSSDEDGAKGASSGGTSSGGTSSGGTSSGGTSSGGTSASGGVSGSDSGTSDAGSDANNSDAAASPFPNEPPGFTAIAEYNGGIVPPDFGPADLVCASDDPSLLLGCVVGDSESQNSLPNQNGSVLNTPNSPASPGSSLRVKFSKGLKAGHGPGWFNIWGPKKENLTGFSVSEESTKGHELKQMYASYHFRLASGKGDGKWQATMCSTTNANCKGEGIWKIVGYFGFGSGNKTHPFGTQAFFLARTVDRETGTDLTSRFSFSVEQQGPTSVPNAQQIENSANVIVWNKNAVFIVDQWHQFEYLTELNDIGKSNGSLKVWIDGILIYHANGITYRTAADPRGFYAISWAPILGAGHADDPLKSRDDYQDIDHVYISGIKL